MELEKDREAVAQLEDVAGAAGVIVTLVQADASLAQIAISEAVAAAPAADPKDAKRMQKKIAEAQQEMLKAAEELAKNKKDSARKAIEHYKHAWHKAMEALKKVEEEL